MVRQKKGNTIHIWTDIYALSHPKCIMQDNKYIIKVVRQKKGKCESKKWLAPKRKIIWLMLNINLGKSLISLWTN